MIKATAFDNHAEIKIISDGTRKNFFAELDQFKQDIQSRDRHFNKDKKCWVVNNIEKYAEVPYIKSGIQDRKIQLKLL